MRRSISILLATVLASLTFGLFISSPASAAPPSGGDAFETPNLGGAARQVINPYTSPGGDVTFTALPSATLNGVVGLVKNSATSACVDPASANQKLGTVTAGSGSVGLSGYAIKADFDGVLGPVSVVSAEFQSLVGTTARIRLYGPNGNLVATSTNLISQNGGTCGYPGGQRGRVRVTMTAIGVVDHAVLDIGANTNGRVFVIDNFRYAQRGVIPRCSGVPATILGTNLADNIVGTPAGDVIHGLGGNDIIRGMGGSDLICGGDGDDAIDGKEGFDRIFGERGDDSLWGSEDADRISGGNGRDRLMGGDGDDTLAGGADDDFVRGGNGDDAMFGFGGDDEIRGGNGDDRGWGGPGDDDLFGATDNDLLWGGRGNDVLRGGTGDDGLRGNTGNDTLLGNPGRDRLFGNDGADRMHGGTDRDYCDGGAPPIGDSAAACEIVVNVP